VEEETGKEVLTIDDIPVSERQKMIKILSDQMKQSAELLDFEEATRLRDQIKELEL